MPWIPLNAAHGFQHQHRDLGPCLLLGERDARHRGADQGPRAVPGTSFIDCLRAFQDDPETEGVIMIGEIGGSAEEEAAEFIKANMTKPVVAYVAGVTAPSGKKMGHAGAIISGSKGTAKAKMEALTDAGAKVAQNPTELGDLMVQALAERK